MRIVDFTARLAATPLAAHADSRPWDVTSRLEDIIVDAIAALPSGYRIRGVQAAHESATIEEGATLKGPVIIGPQCLIARTAYLRGGVFMDEVCIAGPSVELKSTIMLFASKVAHLSFVGDSILGEAVNVEAGAIIANYRNERTDKRIRFIYNGSLVDTGA